MTVLTLYTVYGVVPAGYSTCRGGCRVGCRGAVPGGVQGGGTGVVQGLPAPALPCPGPRLASCPTLLADPPGTLLADLLAALLASLADFPNPQAR